MIIIRKMLMLEVEDPDNDHPWYFPLLAVTNTKAAVVEDYLVPIFNTHRMGAGMEKDYIRLEKSVDFINQFLVDYIQKLQKDGEEVYYSEGMTKGEMDIIISADQGDLYLVKDAIELSYILVGQALKDMETIEEYTRRGCFLSVFGEYKPDRAKFSRSIHTSDHLMVELDNMKIEASFFLFKFHDMSLALKDHRDIFTFKETEIGPVQRIKVLVNQPCVIDMNPTAENEVERMYYAGLHPEVGKPISTRYIKHALRFVDEQEAMETALKHVSEFKSGGFEVVALTGRKVVHIKQKMKKDDMITFWA